LENIFAGDTDSTRMVSAHGLFAGVVDVVQRGRKKTSRLLSELRALNEAIAEKRTRLVSLSVPCRHKGLLKNMALDSHDSHSNGSQSAHRAMSLPVVTKRNVAVADFTTGEWNGSGRSCTDRISACIK
jgi:hypothetical protein